MSLFTHLRTRSCQRVLRQYDILLVYGLTIILYILWITVVLLWNMLACFANFNAGMNIDKSFLKFLPRRVLYSFCRAFGLEVKRISCYTIVKAPPHNSRLAPPPCTLSVILQKALAGSFAAACRFLYCLTKSRLHDRTIRIARRCLKFQSL